MTMFSLLVGGHPFLAVSVLKWWGVSCSHQPETAAPPADGLWQRRTMAPPHPDTPAACTDPAESRTTPYDTFIWYVASQWGQISPTLYVQIYTSCTGSFQCQMKIYFYFIICYFINYFGQHTTLSLKIHHANYQQHYNAALWMQPKNCSICTNSPLYEKSFRISHEFPSCPYIEMFFVWRACYQSLMSSVSGSGYICTHFPTDHILNTASCPGLLSVCSLSASPSTKWMSS